MRWRGGWKSLAAAGVLVLATGAWVYVADQGAGDMSVIDTRANRIVAVIPVGRHPYGVAVGG